ncbi:MAG: TolC family protein [Desulfobacterales bacterium]|nr:TolC family protein [Desulfobacterales bacterium]
MVDPAGTERGPRRLLSGYAPWIAATQACLIIAMLVMVGGVMCWCRPAQGADQHPAAQTPAPGTPLTFEEAVKIAITQSPAFTKSSLEIDIGRLDETDSRYAMVPPLTFRTYYYVNRPSGTNYGKPYSLNFSTEPYNPLGAYFSLQARKLATQAAILGHLGVISGGLQGLGSCYLQLDALHKQAGIQKDLIKVAQENLTYAENRVAIGTGTSLEVKMAQQQLQLSRGEQEGIALAEKGTLSSLRNLLGWPANQDITPAFYDSRRQVLGSFNPATVTLEQAKTRSYELKGFEIYKQLQQYNIRLAIAKSLPTIIYTAQTPDPLSVSQSYGLYVGLGLEIPVWDGFTRIRNVSRQKAILKQIGANKGEKESLLADKWFGVLGKINEYSVALKNAQSLEELARLKSHQQEVRYHSGEAPLSAFLESRIEVLKAQKTTLNSGVSYDQQVLKLRELSGDLGNTYVDASAWQK